MDPCPPRHELEEFMAQSVDNETRLATEEHVRRCALCQETLSDLSSETDVASWRRRLQKHGRTLEAEERLHLRQILEELKSNPPLQIDRPQRERASTPIQFPGVPKAEAPLGRLGEYNVIEELGRGTFGTVYRAFDCRLQRDVAIKVLNPEQADLQCERDRFEQEARAASQLGHDHIVRIYDVRTASDFPLPYLVMELIDGPSLAEQLTRQLTSGKGPFPPQEAARVARQVALALQAAHERGLVHRDIKSSNILLERSTGRGKVTDFGLAHELIAPNDWNASSGRIIGTLPYMSPEQILSPERIGPHSDLYSLGVVLYELLTGERPFRGVSSALLVQVVHDDPQPLRRLHAAIPRDLQTICLKCLEKEPRKRYSSAKALGDELQRFLAGEPIRARPVPAWERAVKWAKRQRIAAALVVAVFLVTGLGFSGVLWQWGRAESGRRTAQDAKSKAEHARDREQALREQLEQTLYFHRVSLAHREWLTNRLPRADQLLAECPEEYRGWEWRYLTRLFHSEIRALRGHTLPIRRVAFSADGRWIASASGLWNARDPGEVIVWDAHTGQRRHTFVAQSGAFYGVTFSPDGMRLAAAGAARGVSVWDMETGHEEDFEASDIPHASVAFSPGGKLLAAAGFDRNVRLWRVGTGELRPPLTGHTGRVSCVAFSPDGKWLASTAANKTARIWDVESGESLQILKAAGNRCVAFTPDGRYLASCGYDGATMGVVKVWEVGDQWNESVDQRIPTGEVSWLSISPDGRYLALNNRRDGTVRVLETTTGRERRLLRAHAVVQGVAFGPDGRTLASGGTDRLVKLWDITEELPVITREDGAHVPAIAFSPNNKHLAIVGGYNSNSPGRGSKTIQIWDVSQTGDFELRTTLSGHQGWISSVAYCTNGRQLASADRRGVIRLWNASNGRTLRAIEAHEGEVTCVVFSPDRSRLVSSGRDRHIKYWDPDSGKLIRTLSGHDGSVNEVAFSPDGRFLASASADKTVRLWDATTGRALQTLDAHRVAVNGVVFDHTGQQLASCDHEGLVKLWDVSTTPESSDVSVRSPVVTPPRRTLQGHTASVSSVSFSSDGSRLASIGDDEIVKLWDVETGRETITLMPFRGSNGRSSVAFSSGGHLLAASRGRNVTLWSAGDLPQLDTATRVPNVHRRAISWHDEEATASVESRDWYAAMFHRTQLIALEPDEPSYYFRRGTLYTQLAESGSDVTQHREHALTDYEQAVRLSGGRVFTGEGDYLSAPHISFDEFPTFTIEAWFYDGYRGAIVSQGRSGDPENSIWLSPGGNFGAYESDTAGWENGSGADYHEAIDRPLPLQWNHIALVYDGSDQHLFLNGERLKRVQAPNPGPLTRERRLMIGGHQSGRRKVFSSGFLRSIRISKQAVYRSDFTPNDVLQARADTVLLFQFGAAGDWKTSQEVTDLSGNGNNGTLHGAWWIPSAD